MLLLAKASSKIIVEVFASEEMNSLAIIFDGNIDNLKGKVNAIINRIHYLAAIADFKIDVYSVQLYDSILSSKLKHKNFVTHRPAQIELDGIPVNVIWVRNHFVDLLLTSKFKKKPVFRDHQLWRIAERFSGYDAISSHSFTCSDLARIIGERYNIPFFCTWHGSEIHSIPSGYRFQYRRMSEILSKAKCNFFVSRALAKTAKERITSGLKYEILYNGVNSFFYRYEEKERQSLRVKYGVHDKKVVSYVGNLIEVKNPQLLAPIFKKVLEKYSGKVQFWVIGDGSMHKMVEEGLVEAGVDYKMWGNQQASSMPSLYQCVDVDILVSKNEGLPLTIPEAIACGACAVGAKVGGIPEVLSPDNVFEHGPDFVERVSDRVVNLLEHPQLQTLSKALSWENTAKIENEIYKRF